MAKGSYHDRCASHVGCIRRRDIEFFHSARNFLIHRHIPARTLPEFVHVYVKFKIQTTQHSWLSETTISGKEKGEFRKIAFENRKS